MNANNPFATRLAAAAAATRGSARRDGLDKIEYAAREEAQERAAYARKEGIAMHFTEPTTGPTERQEQLIQALLTERDLYSEKRPKYIDRISALYTPEQRAAQLTPGKGGTASAFIEYLFTLPMKARKHATDALIPEGLYAVEIDIEGLIFVKVDHGSGKWDGYTFVTRQVGSDFVRVNRRVADAAQAAIRKVGFKESSIRYGLELGHCGRCGRELTNEASREAGIGPICAGKDW
jgi:hypothetical protein